MGKSSETSTLDARDLLVHQIDDFHKKEFEIGGDIQALWGYLDIYLQRLESVRGFVPTESDPIAPLEKHTPNYRKARTDLFLYITRTPNFDIKKLKNIRIDGNGILSLNYIQKTVQVNVIDIWNNSILPKPSTEPIYQKTKQGIESLEKSMEHESYLGGAVIIDYLPGTIGTLAGAHSLYWTGKKGVEFAVKSIRVKNISTGQFEVVAFPVAYRGTMEAIRGNISKILEKSGYLFSPETGSFFHPIERALGETKEVIRKMNYEEYTRNRGENKITREQFEGMKKAIITKIDIRPTSLTWPQYLEGITKGIGKHAGELIFFPVFMHSFSKYQNTATAIAGLGDMAVFTVGAKMGRYIPAPPFLRWATPLIGGGLAIVGTHAGMEAADITKKKWQYLFDNGFGSIYTKGKTYTGHLAGNLGVFNIAEYTDIANKASEKFSELTGIGNPNARIDIGISRTELPIPGINGYLGTIPEITWFQSNINLGTNPWDWVRGAMGRDIDDWNKQVGSYNVRLKRAIGDILGKYERNESMFATEGQYDSHGGKDGILRTHLLDILNAGSDGGAFDTEKTSLVESIIVEARKGKSKESLIMVNSLIDQKTSMMYIDDFFMSKRREGLGYRKEAITNMLNQISNNPAQHKYITSILDRMMNDKPIVSDGKWEEYKAPLTGEKLKRWIPSEENKIYQELLSDKTVVIVNFAGKDVELQRGQAFAEFLDIVLEYKRESEFLDELKKGNKKGVEWTL